MLYATLDECVDDYVDDLICIAFDVFVAACIEHNLPVLDTHDRCVANVVVTYDVDLPPDVFAAWVIALRASYDDAPLDDVNFADMRDAIEMNPKSRIARSAYTL